MTLQLVASDVEAALCYWEAKIAGEDFVLGDTEIGPSAYFTKFGSSHPHLWAIQDGFADGMREARDTSFSEIRATLKLVKGAAA